MIAPGMVSDGRKIIVAASAYQWNFNPGALTAVEIDDAGNVTKDLVPPSNRDTPEMLFAQPAYKSAIIGMRIGTNIVAYQDDSPEHAFPAAFRNPNSKVQPAQLTIPTLRYESGRRVYFVQARKGAPTPLPPVPAKLRRLSTDTILALPTPNRDTRMRWEVEPTDHAFLTFDPFMPDPPAYIADNSHRMGRPR